MNCATCSFYAPANAQQGECRESPPRVFPVPIQTIQGQSIGFQPVFPTVTPECWCGGHSDFVAAAEGSANIIQAN